MNARIVSPEKGIIEEITTVLGVKKDYSNNLVVFPGRRPSHFLRKALGIKTGGSFLPPAILSMDGFVDRVCGELSPGRRLEKIDAIALLYDIHKRSGNPLGGQEFMTADSFFPIGMKIFSDIEELLIEDIHPQKVRDIDHFVQEMVPARTLEKLQTLSFFYEEFYKSVREKGCSTRALRYSTVARDLDPRALDDYESIIIAGFFSLTKCEEDIFRKLDSGGKALFLFQAGKGLAERLSGLGVNIEERPRPAPPVKFYSSPDTHGQMFALNSLLEQAGEADERTAVVLPSAESLFPLVRHGLSRFDDAGYNISIGYPLQRTPLFGFFMNLMELVASWEDGRFYVPAYIKFVLHPYIKNIYLNNDAEITRIMFHAIEDGFARRGSRRFVSLEEVEDSESLRSAHGRAATGKALKGGILKEHLRTIHEHCIEEFLAFSSVQEFAGKCADLIRYVHANSTARLHPLFSPFAEAFIRSLDNLGSSFMKDVSFDGTGAYFSFFRKYILTGRVPFDGTPLKGLQVLGLLETRGLRFEKVYVLDANEDALPATGKDDSLLPFRARLALGLPTYLDRDGLAAYYFDALVGGAQEVALFFVESDTKARSRFVEQLLWDIQKKGASTDTGRLVGSVQYEVDLGNRDHAPVWKSEEMAKYLRDFRYSPTAVDRYLKCPLRFYYTDVLGTDRKRGASDEIEKTDVGQTVHGILSAYFSPLCGRALREEDLDRDELKRTVKRHFRERYGEAQTGALYLYGRQVERHLEELLLRYFLPLVIKEEVAVLENEQTLRMELEGFHVKGRLDTVLKRDLRTFIVDYKTGANAKNVKINLGLLDPEDRDTWHPAVGSFQLPLYLLLYQYHSGISLKDLSGYYLFLGRSVINSDIEVPLFGETETLPGLAVVRETLVRIIEEICDPAVPFSPAADRKRECPSCDFHYVCGTQWIVGATVR